LAEQTPTVLKCTRSVANIEQTESSPERKAALNRWALRAYDACATGDLPNAKGVFDRLDRSKY
jgi:hypothetical protein